MIIEEASLYGVISAKPCALHTYVITPNPGDRQHCHPVPYMES